VERDFWPRPERCRKHFFLALLLEYQNNIKSPQTFSFRVFIFRNSEQLKVGKFLGLFVLARKNLTEASRAVL
jgi:hypothetical protein